MKTEIFAKRDISRREFLRVSGLATAGVVLVACAGGEAAAPAAAPTEAAAEEAAPAAMADASKFKEAPMLAELVASGELPPVDERLPINPLVLPVIDAIRQVWRRH